MENKNMPTSGDEKTKVISVTPSPVNRPAAPTLGTATANSSNLASKQGPPKSPFASYFNDGNSKVKRTILAGAIGGGLLVSFLALTSFKKADEEETPADGSTGSGTTTPEISEGEVVSINTGHEVYTGLHDDLSLDEVRDIARENVGAEGLFMYKDEVHPAMTNEEWNNQTSEQALDYINKVNVIPPSEDDVVTLPIDINGETKDLKLDPLHKADLIQIGTDDSGRVFVIPQGRSASELQNIAVGENGVYYRTDPVTGEMKVFTIEEVLTQIDQKGTVEVEVIVPGIEEPVIEGTYMYGYVDNAYSDSGIFTPGESAVSGYGWGWDTDGDDDIDIYDDDYPVTAEPDPYWLPDDSGGDPTVITPIAEYVEPVAKTDRELLDERIAEMARESGMDPKKIKVHENSDGSWDVKIKGEDGEKIKTTITRDDLQRTQSETVLGTIESDDSLDVAEDVDEEIPEGEIAPENVLEANSDLLLADNSSTANDPTEDVLNTSFSDDPIGGQNSDTDRI